MAWNIILAIALAANCVTCVIFRAWVRELQRRVDSLERKAGRGM